MYPFLSSTPRIDEYTWREYFELPLSWFGYLRMIVSALEPIDRYYKPGMILFRLFPVL